MKRLVTASITDGLVGIWWYTPLNKFWSFKKDIDTGYNDGNYIQYDKEDNHLSLWKSAVNNNLDDTKLIDSVYAKGYKSFERGRVIYNIRTHCYEILCSSIMYRNSEFRNAILDEFNLRHCRYDFIPMQHYQKVKLTGNPELDKFYYENQE